MKIYGLLVSVLLLGLLALFALAEMFEIPWLSDPEPWLSRGRWPAALTGLGLLVSDVLLPVPASLVMIANGLLFGVVTGTLLSLAGSLGAAVFGFSLGRLGGPLLSRLVPTEERRRADGLLQRWGALAVVITRPVPILAETVAILAGTSPMGWGRLLLASFAGNLPACVIYAATGATAADLEETLLILVLVLLISGVTWILGRRMGPRGPEHP